MNTQNQAAEQSILDMRDTKYELIGILQRYAPRLSAQTLVVEMGTKAVSEGITQEELVKMYANALSSGLNYGNWPWSSTSVTAISE